MPGCSLIAHGIGQRNTELVPRQPATVVWNVETGERLLCVEGERDKTVTGPRSVDGLVREIWLSGDGNRLLIEEESSESEKNIQVYSVDSGQPLESKTFLSRRALVMDRENRLLAVGSFNGSSLLGNRSDRVELFELDTMKSLWAQKCPGGIRALAFAPDSSEVVATWSAANEMFGGSGGVRVWNVADGDLLLADPSWPNGVRFIRYHDDGTLQAGDLLFQPVSAKK